MQKNCLSYESNQNAEGTPQDPCNRPLERSYALHVEGRVDLISSWRVGRSVISGSDMNSLQSAFIGHSVLDRHIYTLTRVFRLETSIV